MEKEGKEPRLPGLNLTHEQLFFLNFAQVWGLGERKGFLLEPKRMLSSENLWEEAWNLPPSGLPQPLSLIQNQYCGGNNTAHVGEDVRNILAGEIF